MHNCTIISLAVQKSGGGPTKTIGAFKSALDADLYSFCDRRGLDTDPLAVPGAQAVGAMPLPFLPVGRWWPREFGPHADRALRGGTAVAWAGV